MATGTATHVAVYQDEFGQWQETPLNLPAALVPGLGAVAGPIINGAETTDADGNTHPVTPQAGIMMQVPIAHPQHPGMAGVLPHTFAAMPGMPGVAPLNTIPSGIPVLLPMPQFTAEQLANLNKLNLISMNPTNPDSKDVKAVKPKSTLKPLVTAFKPLINSQKLEDIKEEEENENMDSLPNSPCSIHLDGIDLCDDNLKLNNNNKHSSQRDDCDSSGDDEKDNEPTGKNPAPVLIARVEPKSAKECLESLRNDLIEDEMEDEWVEISDLDSTVYPATLWCLHANSFTADATCSLKNLQASMASALMTS